MAEEIPTPLHLVAIDPGDHIWVTQGKTDHMATYVGEIRRTPASESNDGEEEQFQVMIRWATTGTKGYVNASSVRRLIQGERRRRQVVDHYMATPSQARSIKKKTHSKNDPSSKQKKSKKQKKAENVAPNVVGSTHSLDNRYLQNDKRAATGSVASTVSRSSSKKSPAAIVPRLVFAGKLLGSRDYAKLGIDVNDSYDDPNHTIDKGAGWEWEASGPGIRSRADYASKSGIVCSSNNIVKAIDTSIPKPVPKHFGKRSPRSWNEAFGVLQTYFFENGNCTVPADHPTLGNFVSELRSEFAKSFGPREQQATERPEDPLKDMTRLDRKRLRRLKKLGFQWKAPTKKIGTVENLEQTKTKKTTLSDSETETEDEEYVLESGPRSKKGVRKGSFDSNDNDNLSIDYDKNSSHSRGSISSSSSMSSSSSEFESQSQRDDHSNDDNFLIVSGIEKIDLSDTCSRTVYFKENRLPTLPIHLYRLLRFSALHPEQGFNKFIRWTKDGQGFRIVDEDLFFANVVRVTSAMSKLVSFRNAIGQFNFVLTRSGSNRKGGTFRIYQHRSIQEAREAKDPSLRQFYRGVPLESLWKITSRKQNHKKQISTSNNGITKVSAGQKRKRAMSSDDSLQVDEYQAATKSKSGRKIMPVDRSIWKLDNGEDVTNDDDDEYSNDDNADNSDDEIVNENRNFHGKLSRDKEREMRRTKDGCLRPKGGSDKLLTENGTYDKPKGMAPRGLLWDPIRGLWVPPDLLSQQPAPQVRPAPQSSTWGSRTESRRTSDGCLLPKHVPLKLSDGTYKQPMGHLPREMKWDGIKGLWVPKDRKVGNASNNSKSSSSGHWASEDDGTIISASKAKPFRPIPSDIWRSYNQFKKPEEIQHIHAKKFQARTKKNPSGVIEHKINLKNWGKIVQLMKRGASARTTNNAERESPKHVGVES